MRLVVVIALAVCGGCSSRPLVTLPYVQEFSAAALGPEWSSTGGGWRLSDGQLFNDGARNVPLWLSAALPADVRVSFDARSRSEAVDIKFEIFGDGRNHQSGYVVILAGWNNTKGIIARLNEHGPERTPDQTARLRAEVAADPAKAAAAHASREEIVARYESREPNRLYHFRFERAGHELRCFVDDELYLAYFDPAPLAGAGHDRFAFNNWASAVTFDNLRIEALR